MLILRILLFVIILSFCLWLFNRRFRHNIEIRADIEKIGVLHIGMGYYHKRIYYSYVYNDSSYSSSFTIGNKVGIIDTDYDIIVRIDTLRHKTVKYLGKINTNSNVTTPRSFDSRVYKSKD